MSQPARVVFLLMAMFVALDGLVHRSWWETVVGALLVAFWIYFITRAAASEEDA